MTEQCLHCLVTRVVRLYTSTLPVEQFDQRAKNELRLTTSAAQCAAPTDLPALEMTE